MGVFCTSVFHNLHELVGQAHPNRRVSHDRMMQDYSVAFVDDSVLLVSSESGLQHALNRFAAA